MLKQCVVGQFEYVPGVGSEQGTIKKTDFAVISPEGVKLKFEPLNYEKKNYLTGGGNYDKKMNGANISVELELEEYEQEVLSRVLSYFPYDSTSKRIRFELGSAFSFRKNAKGLYIHPIEMPDDSDDIVIYKAGITGEVELVFHGEEDQPIPIVVDAFPIPFKDQTGKIMKVYGHWGSWEEEFIENEGQFVIPLFEDK